MIKEIRIGMDEALLNNDYTVMQILKDKGFPCTEGNDPRPKAGLKYFEFHDYKTDEIVIQWEEPL